MDSPGADASPIFRLRANAATVLRSLFGSLDPKSEIEAEIVEAQLDLLRTSFRFFDCTLPIAGGFIYIFQRFGHASIGVWWVVLCLNCLVNEVVLSRKPAEENRIARARRRARLQVVLCSVFAAVWVWVTALLWNPSYAPNMMFIEFILACTLAAIATMASLHVASCALPLLAISAGVLIVPTLREFHIHIVVFGVALVYVGLMIGHACIIQLRTVRMLRLESERSHLIIGLRRAKEESERAHQHALAASRAKSEFLANMSHELRTPLNAIIGFSDIVRTKAFGESAEKYCEYGGFIHQSGHKLLDLIGDVLDLAKIEAGRKVLNLEPIDVASLIADEARKADSAATPKQIAVTTAIAPNLPLVKADLYALRQILAHLLSNAVKFTDHGGRIVVAAGCNLAGEVEIAVTDSGIGIPLEDQPHIFERFGEARAHVTSPGRGSGLGLPIVKGLADIHGARIALTSAPGEGTRIALIFPPEATMQLPARDAASA